MKKYIETAIMLAAVCGFFGFIYPELCLMEDTCKVIIEMPKAQVKGTEELTADQAEAAYQAKAVQTEAAQTATAQTATAQTEADQTEAIQAKTVQTEADQTKTDILRKISTIPPERIRIKSKLFEYLLEIR